jgi:hypothetical protein
VLWSGSLTPDARIVSNCIYTKCRETEVLRWITLARSGPALVRIGIATIAVVATTGLQLPVEINFPGQPFLLYFVAVVASARWHERQCATAT